jgi:sigma-B regulation protein RsbU (phosphoserine phosphatase)
VPGWDFAARWQPAREVAGDYYDFIPGEAPDYLGLVIADVTDKGMAAALFMALTRSTVRACLGRGAAPADGVALANQLIAGDATNGMFVTLCYAQLDLAAGNLVFVNAGHNPPLVYQAAGERWLTLTRTGMALGILPEAHYEQRTLALSSGDFVLLYTDGVTDALNAQGEDFGLQRLRSVVAAHRAEPATQLLAALEQALADFTGAAAPFDDLTLLIARRQ